MGWHEGWGWGLGTWIGMGLLMLVFWALVVIAIVVLVRSIRSGGPAAPPPASPDARRILDERFARGELTEEEYLRRRQVLGGD